MIIIYDTIRISLIGEVGDNLLMANKKYVYATGIVLASLLLVPLLSDIVTAQQIPDWVKNTAKWFGDDLITEGEFLNAIKFLIENDIIIIEKSIEESEVINPNMPLRAEVIMPNGNAEQSNTGFFVPINLDVKVGTTVVWINDDNFGHTVQSMDDEGKPTGLFNSDLLQTGERFAFTFDEAGVYKYYCTIHPWRIGQVTVT